MTTAYCFIMKHWIVSLTHHNIWEISQNVLARRDKIKQKCKQTETSLDKILLLNGVVFGLNMLAVKQIAGTITLKDLQHLRTGWELCNIIGKERITL